MPTPNEAVESAASHFATAEAAVQKAIDNLNKLPKDFKDVHAGGPLELPEGVKQFGYLEMSVYAAEARAIAGVLASAQLSLFQLHQSATARAQELQIDIPSILSGGGR